MRISFHGACREVTGSAFLVKVEDHNILLDCGLFQGSRLAEGRNFEAFGFDPRLVDAVIVGHAHLDHTGRLPKLVREGFGGKIYSTPPTYDLSRLVLEDNQKLMAQEAQRDFHSPLYDKADIERTMQQFSTISYRRKIEIADGVHLTFLNAGHILGSAITLIETRNTRLVYTSDLGNTPSNLMAAPDLVDWADVLICESTYGGRVHEDTARRHEKLNAVIESTITKSAVLLIPSFSVERTQELLHDIEHFCTANNCQLPTFVLDSPLAARVTAVFEKYLGYLNPNVRNAHRRDEIFGLGRVRITMTSEESKQIEETATPKIIIAGSGMLNGGRILFHLQDYIENPKNTLLVVGYQAQGTLGRQLLNGAKTVKIYGKSYKVGLKVTAIGSYSAHADMTQILSWTSHIKRLQKVFLVHGEGQQAIRLSGQICAKMGVEVFIPRQGELYEL